MPRRPPEVKRPKARPKKHIDWEVVDRLLMAQCTGSSIAAKLGMHPDTLYERCEQEKGVTFSAYAQEKKINGDDLLRQVQYSKALKGDNVMLVWLGKNRMGQTDKIESKVQAQHEVTQKAILELPGNGRRKDDAQQSNDSNGTQTLSPPARSAD